ncbi:MAG: flagellar motor protein MotB [Nitrospirota bacterium]|nr:flagellar motor protein MotB [Nitrospirota bacterium]
MHRKKKTEDHENLDRWLVSYADFITLLFTFFVMMYAMSSLNKGTYKVISSAIMETFKHHTPRQHLHVIIPHSRTMAGKSSPVTSTILRQVLQLVYEKSSNPGMLAVVETGKSIRVRIQAGFLFSKGHARVRKEALPLLRRIARILAENEEPIRVEGHTDNIPIHGRYPNNWTLSAARAVNVLRMLISLGPLDPKRTSTVAYGFSHPLGPNDTPEDRRKNRRVEIVILKKPISSLPKPSSDIFHLPAPRI